MKILHQNIKIPALKGTRTIAQAPELFTGWLDSDFKNCGTDIKGSKTKETKETKLVELEMDKDATFADIFTDPEAMALSQEQILYFVENHKDKLHPDGWYTFFLFKVSNDFFVAHVSRSGRGLRAFVVRLSRGSVWNADDRRRVVVPQHSLESSDSLSLAIETVKKAGYKIIKEI